MGLYLLRRLLHLGPVLLGVSLIVFLVLHLTPGDPAEVMLGSQATREDLSRLRAQLYREAQNILADDAPWVFVDHEIQIAATGKRVQGFKLHPSFDLRVETISLR